MESNFDFIGNGNPVTTYTETIFAPSVFTSPVEVRQQWDFCPGCGSKLQHEWKFCSGCGKHLMCAPPYPQVTYYLGDQTPVSTTRRCAFDGLPPGAYNMYCPCPKCSPQCS